MKKIIFIIGLGLLSNVTFADTTHGMEDLVDMIKELYAPDGKTNMSFSAYTNCPPQFTNSIYNTNLFTLEQQKIIKEILEKYSNLTTNSLLPGTVLSGKDVSSNYCILHFKHTSSDATEDVIFRNGPGFSQKRGYEALISPLGEGASLVARYRLKDNTGYDVKMNKHANDNSLLKSDFFKKLTPDEQRCAEKELLLLQQQQSANKWEPVFFVEIKNNKPNGIFIAFGKNNYISELLHFKDGKAFGKWLMWSYGKEYNYLVQITLKSPMDYFYYVTQEIRM